MQYATASFTGSVSKLAELFNEILTKLKSSSSQPLRNGTASGSLPFVASLAFRLHLLHPEHYSKISKLETGELAIGMSESKLMNVEAFRRLSLSEWPHDYE